MDTVINNIKLVNNNYDIQINNNMNYKKLSVYSGHDTNVGALLLFMNLTSA